MFNSLCGAVRVISLVTSFSWISLSSVHFLWALAVKKASSCSSIVVSRERLFFLLQHLLVVRSDCHEADKHFTTCVFSLQHLEQCEHRPRMGSWVCVCGAAVGAGNHCVRVCQRVNKALPRKEEL